MGTLLFRNEDSGENDAEAVRWLERAAELGDIGSQVKLGVCYQDGYNVLEQGKVCFKEDMEKAVELFQNAAEQGDAEGQFQLANSYRFGLGVKKNVPKMLYWLRLSAMQGYAEAQYALGICYQDGIGVKADIEKAMDWYERSAAQNYPDAICSVGMYYLDEEDDVETAKRLVYKAAQMDCLEAQYLMGMFLYEGDDSEEDEEAVAWFRMAARYQNHGGAMGMLGYCYMNGTGVEQDDEMARVWLKRAAECRDYDAIELLKNYYMIDDYDDFEYEDYGDEPEYDEEDDDWED